METTAPRPIVRGQAVFVDREAELVLAIQYHLQNERKTLVPVADILRESITCFAEKLNVTL